MSQIAPLPTDVFVDRRNYDNGGTVPGVERRQFSNSHEGLSSDAKELAIAVDEFKLRHRRRYITYEEMMNVISDLGYRKI